MPPQRFCGCQARLGFGTKLLKVGRSTYPLATQISNFPAVPHRDSLNLSLRCSPILRQVILQAVKVAQGAGNLNVEHFFLSLLSLDPSLIFRKLRGREVGLKELISQLRVATENPQGDAVGVLRVIDFGSRIASTVPMNNQHLLVAIILDPGNKVARHLRDYGVNIEALIRRRFTYIPMAVEICRTAQQEAPREGRENSPNLEAGLTLSQVVQAMSEAQKAPVLQRKSRVQGLAESTLLPRNMEANVVRRLAKIIPIPQRAHRYRSWAGKMRGRTGSRSSRFGQPYLFLVQ